MRRRSITYLLPLSNLNAYHPSSFSYVTHATTGPFGSFRALILTFCDNASFLRLDWRNDRVRTVQYWSPGYRSLSTTRITQRYLLDVGEGEGDERVNSYKREHFYNQSLPSPYLLLTRSWNLESAASPFLLDSTYQFSNIHHFWKWNFPMTPHVRLSVGWLVGRSECHYFLQ